MAELKVHFLNVGHGDCTLLQFPSGRYMMVDINNSKALDEEEQKELLESSGLSFMEFLQARGVALQRGMKATSLYEYASSKGVNLPQPVDPVEYLKELGIRSLFRYVQTHPDMDHMSGLYRLHEQERISITNFWDTANDKQQDFSGQGGVRFDKRDWDTYQKIRNSEKNPTILQLYRGSSANFFEQDGITILAPTKEFVQTANEKQDYNKLSYVLLVQYSGHKIVLGGDADKQVWQDIMDDENSKKLIQNVSVLKASHHGRESCFHEDGVKHMAPQFTVCSVGKKPDNDAHNLYNKHTKQNVLSTRFRGNITLTVTSEGKAKISY